MKKLRKLFAASSLFGYAIILSAQTTLPASGGNASGFGGVVSYTVGQLVYTTNPGINGSAAQGVQQPYEISILTGPEEARDIAPELVAYPNPAADAVKLKIKDFKLVNLSYHLYDYNGRMLQTKKIDCIEPDIRLGNYTSGIYFLKVELGTKEIKTFRIIKN